MGKKEDILKKLKNKYLAVLTGHTGLGYNQINELIKLIRQYNHTIIIGGTIVTAETELMMNSLRPDFGVIGEGEISIIELLKCIKNKGDYSKVNGIAFFKDKLVMTRPRERIKNLDTLPFPELDDLGFNEYIDKGIDCFFHYFDKPRTYPLIASRGCPFYCTFCYHCLGKEYTIRSVDNIINEIEMAIKKYKINSLYLWDDLFASNKVRLKEFCIKIKEVTKNIPDFKWFCNLWVSSVDEETITLLKDSGCLFISYGFESYNRDVLKSMKKYITPEQIKKAFDLTEKAGIIMQACFIFGDIAETVESSNETLKFWKDYCKGQVILSFIQPWSGSEIYYHCIKKGIIKDRLEHIKSSEYHWFNMTDNMTDKEINKLKNKILEYRTKYRNYVYAKSSDDSFKTHCPFCQKENIYEVEINNKLFYAFEVACRHCKKRYFVVSRLYKLWANNYKNLDFLLRIYLRLNIRAHLQ